MSITKIITVYIFGTDYNCILILKIYINLFINTPLVYENCLRFGLSCYFNWLQPPLISWLRVTGQLQLVEWYLFILLTLLLEHYGKRTFLRRTLWNYKFLWGRTQPLKTPSPPSPPRKSTEILVPLLKNYETSWAEIVLMWIIFAIICWEFDCTFMFTTNMTNTKI